ETETESPGLRPVSSNHVHTTTTTNVCLCPNSPTLSQSDPERKSFINKLYAIQDVCISVQNALDEVASYGERIKNTFNWTVPFLSWLAIVALCVATVLIYYIPLRYIVLAWGECLKEAPH
ncbi:unnamed protein product, partial [Coregonus sp. 'balchen']